jgi:uncharacterized membrane protein YbhN (UPF0104 family)
LQNPRPVRRAASSGRDEDRHPLRADDACVTARRPAWHRWLAWAIGLVVAGAFANLVGWDIGAWFSDLWDTVTSISAAALVSNIALRTVQTIATAYAWYAILAFAYGSAARWKDVLAGYAVSVALNGILPANLGTLVLLIMFSVTIAGASFAGVLGAYAVEKIFFTISGAFVYLYLFLTVGGSFALRFGFVENHTAAFVIMLVGGALLIYLLLRRLWPRVVRWWNQAKDGGAILAKPGRYFIRVFLPSFIGWVAMLAAMAVMLDAYGIPVSFDTLMHVAGGNSLANVTSVTPGGAGINQAFNVASLKHVASTEDATAFSVGSQLINTAWNIILGLVLMIWAWGWTGGTQLVRSSYDEAKRRQAEEREKRRQKKLAESTGQ